MISIISPVLNEAKIIARFLSQFKDQPPPFELIIVDGGSTDQTKEIVRSFPQVKLIESPPGRGKQMNAGAKAAAGEIYLFLHSDTFLPPEGLNKIREVMKDKEAVGGFFGLQHDTDNFWYKRLNFIINYYSNHTNTPYGDQALFCSREAFEKLNGFKEIPIMEDYDFSKRLGKFGKLVKIKEKVVGSFRRYEQGIIKYSLQCNFITLLYHFGASPEFLKKLYKDIR